VTTDPIYELPFWDYHLDMRMEEFVRRMADDQGMTHKWRAETDMECVILLSNMRKSRITDRPETSHEERLIAAKLIGKALSLRLLIGTYNELKEQQ